MAQFGGRTFLSSPIRSLLGLMGKVSQVPNSAHLVEMDPSSAAPLLGLRSRPSLHINRKCHQVLLIRIIVLLPSSRRWRCYCAARWNSICISMAHPSILARSDYPPRMMTTAEGLFIHPPPAKAAIIMKFGIPGKVFQLVLALIRIVLRV